MGRWKMVGWLRRVFFEHLSLPSPRRRGDAERVLTFDGGLAMGGWSVIERVLGSSGARWQ